MEWLSLYLCFTFCVPTVPSFCLPRFLALNLSLALYLSVFILILGPCVSLILLSR